LHSIVQIPLDPAPRLVGGRDDPRPRGSELGPARLELALAFPGTTVIAAIHDRALDHLPVAADATIRLTAGRVLGSDLTAA
jgi:hypothetical protein